MSKQHISTKLLAMFILVMVGVTVWAMRINPPDNLDHVVMGNISGTLVEMAVASDDETLITGFQAKTPTNFFAFAEQDDEDLIDEDGFNGLSIIQPFLANNTEQSGD